MLSEVNITGGLEESIYSDIINCDLNYVSIKSAAIQKVLNFLNTLEQTDEVEDIVYDLSGMGRDIYLDTAKYMLVERPEEVNYSHIVDGFASADEFNMYANNIDLQDPTVLDNSNFNKENIMEESKEVTVEQEEKKEIEYAIIRADFLNAILQYLGQQKYAETAGFCDALQGKTNPSVYGSPEDFQK